MSLITGNDVRIYHNLSSTPNDQFFDIRIRQAERKIINWVGEDAFNDAGKSSPDDQIRATDLKDACCELVLYFALPSLNLHIEELGVIMQSYDPTKHGGATIATANPRQLEAMRQVHLQAAENLCKNYMSRTFPLSVGVE